MAQAISKYLRGKTCYACEDAATSRDHVPPKLFFPEESDLGGAYGNLRRDLITVYACEKHNNEASGDDAYFACFVAVASTPNSRLARLHFETKIKRALDKDPQVAQWFADAIWKNGRPVRQFATVDTDRFDRCVSKIVKGLYYDITRRKIKSETITGIIYPNMFDSEGEQPAIFRTIDRGLKRHLWVRHRAGSPRIFTSEYFLDIAMPHRVAFRLKFYESFEVWAVHDGQSNEGHRDEARTVSVGE